MVRLCGRHHFLRGFAADNGIKAYSNAKELQLTLNGVAQEKIKNGSYRLPDAKIEKKDKPTQVIAGIPVDNVFFWKTPMRRGEM